MAAMSRNGAVVGPARLSRAYIRHGDDVDLVPHMIECEQAVEEHQHAIRQPGRRWSDRRYFPAGGPCRSRIPDGPRRKGRHPGDVRRPVRLQQFFQQVERYCPWRFSAGLPRCDRDFVAACAITCM